MAVDTEDQTHAAAAKKVKFLCSFGGKILPRPSDGALRYVGGQTRIIAFPKTVSFPELVRKMRDVYGGPVNIKYQLPEEDLDALVSVSCGEDLENMMEEYQKLASVTVDASPKLRVFLFAEGDSGAAADVSGDATGQSYMEAVNGIGELRRKGIRVSSALTHQSDGIVLAAVGAACRNETSGAIEGAPSMSFVVQCSDVEDGSKLISLDAVVSRGESSLWGSTFSQPQIAASGQVDDLISTDVRPNPTVPGLITPEVSTSASIAGYVPPTYTDQQRGVFDYVSYVPNSRPAQQLCSEKSGTGGTPEQFVAVNSYLSIPGTATSTVPPPHTSFPSSVMPTTSRLESCLNGSECGMPVKILSEQNHKAFQSLARLPPLPPLSVQAPNVDGHGGRHAWPQVSLPSQQTQQVSALSLEDCLMSLKPPSHVHSKAVIQTVSHVSSASNRIQSHKVSSSNVPCNNICAVLPDKFVEKSGSATEVASMAVACGHSQIPNVLQDIDSNTHCKMVNFDQSRLPLPPGVSGFPSELLSLHELYPNNNAQASCEGLLEHKQHQTLHFFPGQHPCFQEISTSNPISNCITAASYGMLETLGPPSINTRNDVTMPVEGLVEKLSLNHETTAAKEQFKIVEKSNGGSPTEMMSGHVSLNGESRDNCNSQVEEESLHCCDGFVATLSGKNPDKLQPVSSVLEDCCLPNVQNLDSSQVPTLLEDVGKYIDHPGIRAEPPIPRALLLGVSNATSRLYDGEQRENPTSISGNCSKVPTPVSFSDLQPPLPLVSDLDGGIHGTQQPIHSDSLFNDPDPWKTVQNGNNPSPKPLRVACEELLLSEESCADNHLANVGDSLLSITSGRGNYYEHFDALKKQDLLSSLIQPVREKQMRKDRQDVTEDMQVSSIGPSVSRVPVTSHETNEYAQIPNCGEDIRADNVDPKSTHSTNDRKIEGITKKHPDELAKHGFLVNEDIGRLQIIKSIDLEEFSELGSGTYGTVYHGKWRGSDVAIKWINNRCFSGKPSEIERLRADFWNEAGNLADLHHPNVVAFYGVVLDGPGESVATVTEYMVDGSLRQALQRNDKTLDQRKRLLIAMDVAFGMEYLHGKNVVHFDLKSDNLLVNLSDPQRPICKVGDLGLSKVKRQTLISGGVRGTLPWMAPELLSGCSSLVSEKVDVFSFGIVMWELLTGEEPYANLHYGTIIGGIVNNTLRPPVPNSCKPEWKLLMEKCWSSEPSERPTFTEIAGMLRSIAGSLPKRGEA